MKYNKNYNIFNNSFITAIIQIKSLLCPGFIIHLHYSSDIIIFYIENLTKKTFLFLFLATILVHLHYNTLYT